MTPETAPAECSPFAAGNGATEGGLHSPPAVPASDPRSKPMRRVSKGGGSSNGCLVLVFALVSIPVLLDVVWAVTR